MNFGLKRKAEERKTSFLGIFFKLPRFLREKDLGTVLQLFCHQDILAAVLCLTEVER